MVTSNNFQTFSERKIAPCLRRSRAPNRLRLCLDFRFAGKNEPQVVLGVDHHALDQVAPHGFLELRHLIRQLFHRGDEPCELAPADALLPNLCRHLVAAFLDRLVAGNQGVVLYLLL